MQLDGILAEMLIKCDPAWYEKYVIYENNQKILYVELVEVLYGTLHAALISWHHVTHKLLEWGFEINPYDWCVANKQIKGSQCTHTCQLMIRSCHKFPLTSWKNCWSN